MGWFSKFFKGSSHEISEGHCSDNCGDSSCRCPSDSGDIWSDSENEDIHHAIQISLAEQQCNQTNMTDDESMLEEDEQLARAIQESLNDESPSHNQNGHAVPQRNGHSPPRYQNDFSPPRYRNDYSPARYGNGPMYQPMPYYYPMGYRICAGCSTEIGHGRFLSCMNAFWHPECFRCHACHLPISDYEFSMSGNYPYHRSCYKEHCLPKCDVCKNFIPTNPAGLIEYRAHPFWIQKYCPSHEHDNTARCCSCERMETRETNYVELNDGRNLCLECLDSAVMDTNECQPLYLNIQEFYERLNMKVKQQVPLLLVERQALNEAREGEKNGHYHMPETRGLCLSEEQTIRTVSRRPRLGRGQNMDMISEPYKLVRRCEVTAILILYGLPRLQTGTILAHEMMHAWLRLEGYPTLRQDVEEGICQVLAHMWLAAQLVSGSSNNIGSTSSSSTIGSSMSSSRSPFDEKLGEFFKHQIESDTSPVYGGGFRAGLQAVHNYGLQKTLEHIRITGNFPC